MRMAVLLLGTLVWTQAIAAPVDKLMDYHSPLNACLYRYGLTAIGFHIPPAQVRAAAIKACEPQIEELVQALIPSPADGKFSLDVEGEDIARKKARQSKALKFMIDEFVKNYQESLNRALQ